MASKPSINLPRWADTSPDAGAVVEPPSAKKDTGYQFVVANTKGEKPIMNYDNWLMLSTYSWLKWLSENLNLSTLVSNSTTVTALPNDTLILTNPAARVVNISDTIADNDIIEIKEASGNASETDPVVINAPLGFTFEDGSTDAEIQIPNACFTFKVFNNVLYLV